MSTIATLFGKLASMFATAVMFVSKTLIAFALGLVKLSVGFAVWVGHATLAFILKLCTASLVVFGFVFKPVMLVFLPLIALLVVGGVLFQRRKGGADANPGAVKGSAEAAQAEA